MCLGVDDFSFITLGPFKQEAFILGGFLKHSYVISLIIFLFPLSGIPVSWLVDCLGLSFIPLFYLYFCHFVLFSLPGGFLNLILLLNFLCQLLSCFYLQEVFYALILLSHYAVLLFCYNGHVSLMSSSVVLKFSFIPSVYFLFSSYSLLLFVLAVFNFHGFLGKSGVSINLRSLC